MTENFVVHMPAKGPLDAAGTTIPCPDRETADAAWQQARETDNGAWIEHRWDCAARTPSGVRNRDPALARSPIVR